jgi:hypothetical protein
MAIVSIAVSTRFDCGASEFLDGSVKQFQLGIRNPGSLGNVFPGFHVNHFTTSY